MKRQRSLNANQYQRFEDRKMLAGDVTVVENGHLFIRGDELSNQIAIVADDTGQISVVGKNNTTINGATEPFLVRNSIDVEGARSRLAAFEGGLRIQMYGGHDRIDVQGIEFADQSFIGTGAGNDFVRFLRSTSQHEFSVVTGTGDDTLNFVQGRVHGDLEVATGDGHDSIRVQNSRTWAATSISTGAGDDAVNLNISRFTGDNQRVITHNGNDKISFRNNDVNESGLAVYAGDGRDQIFAEMWNSNSVEGQIVLAGQDGYDMLDVDGDPSMFANVNSSGFVSGKEVEGGWWVYERGETPNPTNFQYRASAVEFEQTTRVTTIDWLGSYFASGAPDADRFVIEIFESEAIESTNEEYWYRQPKSESAVRFTVGNDVNRMDTGETWFERLYFDPDNPENDRGVTRTIFSYSAEIDFEFLANTTYWVSIHAITAPIDPGNFTHGLLDSDFAVLLDYPGEPGDYFDYIQPSGTETDPFANTNAVLFDDNVELGVEADRWWFSSSDVQMLFSLNPQSVEV